MAAILMFELLKQPYPTEEPIVRRIVKSVAVGLFIALFLLMFQPFNLDDWQTTNKALKIAGFGGVTTLVLLVNYLALPFLFPRYFVDERWTVGQEILHIIFIITVIAAGNRLYLGMIVNNPLDMGEWIGMVGGTFLVGIFPTTALVLINYIRQLRRYSQSATALSAHTTDSPVVMDESSVVNLPTPSTSSRLLTLLADNEKDKLVIPTEDLLFIESSDNYCTVVYLKKGQPAKPLIRSSLSRLEKQIAQPHIVRCHRSYVVNVHHVERVTGNAQGYKLHVQNGQFQIPVARQYNETLVVELRGL